ncbi:hypothetical protein [Streptomyces sp. RPT161]|uniref:hypothetical protein n=1 Tax=Streptomyces sp. RPT161 TaxID=3015993 RepID=UPI0022B85AE0|nr:hypothetical protein [Streptomyces sp. RPT161]
MSHRTNRTNRTNHRTALRGATIALTAALGLTLAACGSGGSASGKTAASAAAAAPKGTDRAGVPATPRTTAQGRTTLPPWDAPSDASARAKAAQLPMLGAEGQVMHIHTHLDILVNGQPVTVPAFIGIDVKQQRISPLHTHTPDGVIHIESPVKADFTLGQFMTEWNVALGADQLGGLKAGGGKQLRAYVNGKQIKGDPAAIVLRAHDEIALVYGPAGEQVKVPNSFNWPAGE